ncbi:MAG TPA: GNAT family N-acetyltransferase [Patescibacteria group bacterium]|nr:GNAT family N-acetyltransferase [Patescibacteria group bacterium]
MHVVKEEKDFGKAIRFVLRDNDKEIGSAYLYILKNDYHEEPFGFLEYLVVDEAYRGQGLGGEIIKEMIEEAKKQGCYKLVGTSRHGRDKLHKWYEELGFKNYGLEFRINLL